MKLESITVENYRQFEKAELTFDEGITILAGANNSGKTSLINLIKNIFVDDKLNYNMSDIPAKNMREWVEWVYPIFQKFFRDRKTEENVEKDLLNVVIPKEETDSTHLMKMTTVRKNANAYGRCYQTGKILLRKKYTKVKINKESILWQKIQLVKSAMRFPLEVEE